MKTIISFFLLLSLVLSAQAQSPKHEVRAVWLTTIGGIDWPHSYSATTQKAEMISILDQLQQAGINTVLIQTRVRATTIFPTTTEPWDGCLTGHPGTSPGYDPLLFCIDECICRQRSDKGGNWQAVDGLDVILHCGCRINTLG